MLLLVLLLYNSYIDVTSHYWLFVCRAKPGVRDLSGGSLADGGATTVVHSILLNDGYARYAFHFLLRHPNTATIHTFL